MKRHPSPLPPDLPGGAVRLVPGRGELIVRQVQGPPGATPVLLIHGWQAIGLQRQLLAIAQATLEETHEINRKTIDASGPNELVGGRP